MTILTLTPTLVSKAYDTNNDGILNDNLKIGKTVQTLIDTDKNGTVDVLELSKGIEADKVIVREGEVFARKGSLKMAGSFELSSSFDRVNAELYKVQEPLEKFKTAEAEYPTLGPKANQALNQANADARLYGGKALEVADAMLRYARTAPIVTQEKANQYTNLLNSLDKEAQKSKAQANYLSPNVKAMNEAINLKPTSTILDIAKKSYELAVSVSTEVSAKTKTSAGGTISEAKIQIAKLEVEKFAPQVQTINEKITKGTPSFDLLKRYFK